MTVSDIIRMSLRTLGVLAAEEDPSAAEQSDALESLNDMLDSWAGERLALFATYRNTYTLTPSSSPLLVGVQGATTLVNQRPVRVDRASIIPLTSPGTERPLRILSDSEWANAQGKTNLGIPISVWFYTSYPQLSVYLYPIPIEADTLVLYTWQQLGRFPSVSTDFDFFPPGYIRAIRYNLAQELAPEFGLTLSPEAAKIAEESKANIKRLNFRPGFLRTDAALLHGGGRFNLISGDW